MDVLAADISAGPRGWGRRVGRFWWLVAIVVAGTAAVAIHVVSVRGPQYTSTATVAVDLPDQIATQPELASTAMQDELQWAQSLTVAARAQSLLGLGIDATAMQSRDDATQPAGSQLVLFAYTGPSPAAAQQGADAYAQAFVDIRDWPRQDGQQTRMRLLDDQYAKAESALARYSADAASEPATDPRHEDAVEQVAIAGADASTVDAEREIVLDDSTPVAAQVGTATTPTDPSGLPGWLVVGAALVLALVVGLALAILLALRDRRLHRPQDVQTWTPLTVVADVPRRRGSSRWTRDGQPVAVRVDHPGRTAFDRLRLAVMKAAGGDGPTIVAVVSPAEGGSSAFAAVNLVASAARQRMPVVLVCADPSSAVPPLFGLATFPGLAQVLAGHAALDAVRQAPSELAGGWVVPPGDGLDHVLSGVGAQNLGACLRRLAHDGFLVVVQAPAAGPGLTGLEVARLADRTVLVAEVARTRAPDLTAAADELEQAGARLLGVLTVPRTAARSPGVARTGLAKIG